jgi:hypothetical protein
MKTNMFVVIFMVLPVVSVFCGGVLEMEPVNTQKIGLDQINGIEILYRSEEVALFKGTENMLVVKEYMNKNNSNYYARITNDGDKLIIERGRRPFWFLHARVEVYLPVSYTNALNIKSTSGKIEALDEYACSQINIESTSGSISINTITAETASFKNSSGGIRCENVTGNVNVSTSSGNIEFDHVSGNVSARSLSGAIKLKLVNGGVNAKNSSGGIRCAVDGNVGNISLITTSGSVGLNLPENLKFSFSSRTSSGGLSTPFHDKLFSPVTDKKLVEGIIGGDTIPENSPQINIRTTSGSINVNWTS